MKTTTMTMAAAAAALTLGAAATAEAAALPQEFKSVMNGANAGTGSFGDGLALFSLDGELGSAVLTWNISVSNAMDFSALGGGGAGGDGVTGLHLHQAPLGSNGPVIYNILADVDAIGATAGGTELSGTWTSAEGLDTYYALFRDQTGFLDVYANLHTETYPAGAIRGQLEAAAVPVPAALPLGAAAFGLLGLVARRGRRD